VSCHITFLTSNISQLILSNFEWNSSHDFCRRLKRTIFVFFAKWKKTEFRAVIKYLHMKNLMPKEIKVELDNVHSTSALAFVTIYN